MISTYIKSLLCLVVTILLTGVLTGKITIPNLSIPPLASFLHPVTGIWNNGVVKGSPGIYSDPKDAANYIAYDDRRVPHIYAKTIERALFLQGYAEAKDRLFQLDLISRAASGRLSEILGSRTIDIDKGLNRNSLEIAARNAVATWQEHPKDYQLFGHYIDGINQFINELSPKDYPLEFKLLDYIPEPWSYYKSALVSRYMANTLSRREDDVESSNMLVLLGIERFNHLFPQNDDGGYPVIPNEKQYDFDTIYGDQLEHDSIVERILRKEYFEKPPKGVGSNNWVLGNSKTATGTPIFANDPHLSLSLPSIWYECQITTPNTNAYGVTIPGLAGIMMGFNEYISWGETNVGHDVADMHLIKYTDGKKDNYLLDDKVLPVEYEIQEIKVKNGPSVFDTLKYTKWGMIIRESADGLHDVAMDWLAVKKQEKPDLCTFVYMAQSKNYDEFEKANSVFSVPAQNFLFGAKNGDIALRVNGTLPARHGQDGRFLEPGDSSKYGWKGYIPRSQNPQILNPNQDYLTSSNQRSAGADYPYYYTGSFEHFRNISINDKLKNKNDWTIDEVKAMQFDSYSVFAARILPLLLSKIAEENEIVNTLKNWDFQYHRNKVAPTYFNIWIKYLRRATFDEIYEYQDQMEVMIPKNYRLLSLIQNECEDEIFDKQYTITKETCTEIVRLSFQEALKEIAQLEQIKWGEYRPITINHYTRLPALSRFGINTDGNSDAINATSSSFGPSWRMVVSLEQTTKGYGIYPGGQSGNPLDPFYDNMITKWANGQYDELQFWNRDDYSNYYNSKQNSDGN